MQDLPVYFYEGDHGWLGCVYFPTAIKSIYYEHLVHEFDTVVMCYICLLICVEISEKTQKGGRESQRTVGWCVCVCVCFCCVVSDHGTLNYVYSPNSSQS